MMDAAGNVCDRPANKRSLALESHGGRARMVANDTTAMHTAATAMSTRTAATAAATPASSAAAPRPRVLMSLAAAPTQQFQQVKRRRGPLQGAALAEFGSIGRQSRHSGRRRNASHAATAAVTSITQESLTTLHRQRHSGIASTSLPNPIPLIKKNLWRVERSNADIERAETAKSASDSLAARAKHLGQQDAEAARLLIAEAAARDGEEEEDGDGDNRFRRCVLPKSIPLLVQNKVPKLDDYKSETDKFRHDVQMRPDMAGQDAYEKTSVGDFGTAMLLGMGWKPGAPIGGTVKRVVKPVIFERRAPRLGLGATRDMPGRKRGTRVRTGGGVSSGAASASDIKQSQSNSRKRSGQVSDSSNEGDQHRVKRRRSQAGGRSNNSDSIAAPSLVWVVPGITVRIVSHSLGDGTFFGKRAIVDHLTGDGMFSVCVVDRHGPNRIIDNVTEADVHTALPKTGGNVRLVRGSYSGQVGKLLQRTKKSGTAVVQLDDNLAVITVAYDDLAECSM